LCEGDDVLDFARGRSGGGIVLTRKAGVALEPDLTTGVNERRIGAQGRTIETHFALSDPVNCDSSRFGQMVSNLLANGLTRGAATDGAEPELWVAKTGKPITPATLERLLQPFFRGDTLQASKAGTRSAHRLRDRQGAWGRD
jgi:phosphoserine phosphatase RsbU/P